MRTFYSSLKAVEGFEDPNYDAHLPALLKKGMTERPSPNLAKKLRARYSEISSTLKTKMSAKLKEADNAELAAELEEIADELESTHEKFVQAAMAWDAWNRPDPNLPRELRDKFDLEKRMQDPNFDEHLGEFMKKGLAERPDPTLPSELRMMKYKQAASVKRIAAKELKATGNSELAAELDEIADEIEESHSRFVEMASNFSAMKSYEKGMKKGKDEGN